MTQSHSLDRSIEQTIKDVYFPHEPWGRTIGRDEWDPLGGVRLWDITSIIGVGCPTTFIVF